MCLSLLDTKYVELSTYPGPLKITDRVWPNYIVHIIWSPKQNSQQGDIAAYLGKPNSDPPLANVVVIKQSLKTYDSSLYLGHLTLYNGPNYSKI